MNLYWVAYKDHYYGVFVFAEKPNKARALAANYYGFDNDEDYINTRAYIKAKNTEINYECVVDYPEGKEYKVVLTHGCKYDEEEE